MILLPAIDLLEKKAVRLKKGDFNEVTVYSNNPKELAIEFEKDGADYLHLVDLSGSFDGSTINYETIKDIVSSISIPVEVGGGIRSFERAKELIDLGVSRVILGTAAVNDLNLVKKLVDAFGDKVCISLDVLNNYVATHAWKSVSDIHVLDLAKQLEQLNVKTIVCTDISKDGMLTGPNLELYKLLRDHTSLDIIVSGGISSLEDIKASKDLNLYGVISGKAIYENKFTVREAISCLQEE